MPPASTPSRANANVPSPHGATTASITRADVGDAPFAPNQRCFARKPSRSSLESARSAVSAGGSVVLLVLVMAPPFGTAHLRSEFRKR